MAIDRAWASSHVKGGFYGAPPRGATSVRRSCCHPVRYGLARKFRGSCGWFDVKPEPGAFERFGQIVHSGAGFGLCIENRSLVARANHKGPAARL